LILGVTLLAAIALTSAGDIYHCVGRDGAAVFQDKPCDQVRSVLLSSRSKSADGDLLRLRQALKKIERAAPTSPTRAPAKAQTRANRAPLIAHWINRGPADQNLLAACSSRFFECAEANAARMDRCVVAIPRCASGRSANCCPDECITRYLDLRRAEFAPAQSVRDALLDDSVGSCAAR
jgi:hypothetical protein